MTPDNENTQPNAYEVKDDDNLEEKDLQRTFLFGKGDEEENGKANASEGFGEGGHAFGEANNTPSGNDANNPSQNAGNTNAYLGKTEPSDDHPEFINFKDPNQLGQPNYTQAADATNTGQSDTQNTGPQNDPSDSEGSTENKNEQNQEFQESTSGANGDENIPGPNEVPDQQKVGE